MSDYIITLETRNKLDEARYTLANSLADVTNSTDKVLLSLALKLGNTLSQCVITPLTITSENSDQESSEDTIDDITGPISSGSTATQVWELILQDISGTGSGGSTP
jgi:hypothetical protein